MPAPQTLQRKDIFRGALLNILLSSDTSGDPQKVPKEVQILKVGTYNDARYGQFEVNAAMLLAMKTNFDSRVMKIDPAFDYSHESQDVAAGWIKSLELKEDGSELWGIVDWTPTAARRLADKEFRYVSADFTLNFVDNENLKEYGPTLRGAALTNRPVIKGMDPVTLTEGGSSMDPKDKEIAELKQKIAELEKKNGSGKEPDGDEGDKGEKMLALKQQNDEMKKKLAEYADKEKKAEEDKKMSERKSKFDKMLADGKAVKAQEDAFMKGDMDKFFELSEKTHTEAHGDSRHERSVESGKDGSKKDVEDRIIELAEKKCKEDKLLNMPKAISMVLAENADLREERRKASQSR